MMLTALLQQASETATTSKMHVLNVSHRQVVTVAENCPGTLVDGFHQ